MRAKRATELEALNVDPKLKVRIWHQPHRDSLVVELKEVPAPQRVFSFEMCGVAEELLQEGEPRLALARILNYAEAIKEWGPTWPTM